MSDPSVAELRRRLDGLTVRDAARFGRRLRQLRGASPDKVAKLAEQITAAEALVATRAAALPHAAGSSSRGKTKSVRRMASCLTTMRTS